MEKPSQWEKIKEIVGAALEREPGQRAAFLDEVCSRDATLRAEVESLLSAHAGAGGLSESAFATELADTAQVSKSVGPYRLLQKLGEGGMGQVWLAEQTAPVRRKVALKLIKAGMYDESALRRFQSERQSLAIMDHPAIAKVFDAGATPDGQPYFAMEYVPGVAITKYCDEKKLKIRERLELFIRACEAVQHAHQKAIIHRDLKPANILVVEVDGKPVPRIIDFGLAKAVTPYFSGESMNTQAGGFVGTPGYMSPEQADPGIQDVDTRTDVYSLGVVLYELLTGFLPFDTAQWKKLRFEELLRHLREDDPPRPSTKVSGARDTSTSNAQARGTEPAQLVSALRGDLDWITMKALDKDRNRRYGAPSEIAADIRRYLSNEPIIARPASASYRLRKYVRRHRVAVTVAAGLFVLLAVFAGLQAVQLRRITRERDRANRITEFMTNMFKVSQPSEARGNSITAREILDKSSKDIDTGLSKDPELQAKMMDTMGTVYRSLGLYSPSEALLSRSLDIKRARLGEQDPETLSTAAGLATTLWNEGRFPDAEKLLRTTIDSQRRVLGVEDPATLRSMSDLAIVFHGQGHDADAEKLDRQIVEIERRVLGPEHPETLTTISNLALVLRDEGGRYAEAEKFNREVLEARRRTLGQDHPDTLRSIANLAFTLQTEGGRDAEAESLLRGVLETQRRMLGPEHPDTLRTIGTLAILLNRSGQRAAAEQLQRDLLEIQRRTLGPAHAGTLNTMSNLAATLVEEKKLQEAEQLGRQTLALQQEKYGTEHRDTLRTMLNLGATLQDEGKLAEAEKMERQCLEVAGKVLKPGNNIVPMLLYNLSTILDKQGHRPESEKTLREAIEGARHAFGPNDPNTPMFIYSLGGLLAREGRREEALAALREALDHGLAASQAAGLESDPELKSLHGDPRFAALVADARRLAAPEQKH
ncbi:MAG TPA: tetratricopeptide repeat protein [Candidatus Dormibacteraeota bacterium]|nr:tetratricopeptide repeat protein [Candidatus Dormibacteraeota bacterium]